ncbi:F-box protein At5g07610 [Cucurbita pepo subsp. pepo]|uniref:F-box protein At5g07610 n=1 Tax=Cucurbita pepo subsp. pepo TaxID=3664 RepID=UPI000C9D4EBE|nr:F-box protein At5g07610 [Cucurbita pepo subsp. pepo]
MLCSKSPKVHRTSTAATTAAVEPVLNNEDLLLEILIRLPIRSLLTFKSVSKRWLALISNPSFSRRRSISNPPIPSGIFLARPYPDSLAFDFVNLSANPSRAPFESLNFTDQEYGIVINQSCNGLLLCSSSYGNESKRDYYVHNPTTKHFTTLPKLQARKIFGLNLAFDPLRSSDYKVICVRNSDSFKNNYEIEIYSSRSGPWRPCQGVFSAPSSMRFDSGVYWNSAVHWIDAWENCLYFDLREEKLHELPMPRVPEGWEERRVEYFGSCGGNLHLIENYEPQDLVFNVYEMKDDHSGWFVKYRVDLRCVSVAFPEIVPSEENLEFGFIPKFSVIAIVDGTEVGEESYVVLQIFEKIVRVNVESGRFESLVESDNGGGISQVNGFFGQVEAYLYIESLVCV